MERQLKIWLIHHCNNYLSESLYILSALRTLLGTCTVSDSVIIVIIIINHTFSNY